MSSQRGTQGRAPAPLRAQLVYGVALALGLGAEACGSNTPSYGFPCNPNDGCRYDPGPSDDASDPILPDLTTTPILPDASVDATATADAAVEASADANETPDSEQGE